MRQQGETAAMMVKLTSAEQSTTGQPVALNRDKVCAVFKVFDEETRILLDNGTEFIVSQSFDEVTAALSGGYSNTATK